MNLASNNKYLTSPGRMSLPITETNDLSHDDDLSGKLLLSSQKFSKYPTKINLKILATVDDFEIPGIIVPPSAPVVTDAKTLERLSERSYVRDWYRLGLCSSGPQNSNRRNEPFRLTSVNCAYMICRSYPALFIVPSSVTDESIRRFCRLYRHNRIPIVTWRHPRTKALLIRGAGYHGKSVIGMLKAHPASTHNLKGMMIKI